MAEDTGLHSENPQEVPAAGTAEASPPPADKVGTFTSLRSGSFRLLITGSIFAYAIMWIQQVILSWLVYDMTGSGTMLGTINLVTSLSSLCMLVAVGILVDYFNRRKLLMLSSGSMLPVTLALGLVLIAGRGNLLYVFIFAFILGLMQTLDQTLRQVLVFDLLPRPQIPGAMAINQTGWSLMRVLGPSLGGFLLLWFSAGESFLVQAGVYGLIFFTALKMKLPERKREMTRVSPLQNIREGLGYVIREPVTRIFTLIGIIMPILVIPVFATLPAIYAVEVFGDSSGKVLGFLMASVGVGGCLGGIALNYLRRWEAWGLLQMSSLFLVSLTLIGFALCSSLPLALVLLALAGFFELIFLTTNQTLIQLSIPDRIRGRVTAVINLTWILTPVGSLLAGGGSDLLGPKMITLILSVVAAVIVLLVVMVSPTVRNYRLSQGIASN